MPIHLYIQFTMIKKIVIVLFLGIIFCDELDELFICEYCHAHNDYLGDIPLFDALDHGFKSIEIDVVLHEGSLHVAHHWLLKKKNRIIEDLYLDNLYEIYIDQGYIYPNNNSLFLLVDIKTSANETYQVLNNLLSSYRSMLSYVKEDSVIDGAVTVILSGNRPSIDYLGNLTERYVFMDGRLSDLGKNISVDLMPLISIDWKDEFKWRGRNKMSEEETMYLKKLIYDVHLEGKKIRFWGSPDNMMSWQFFYFSGIDLINTDKIIELYDYMRQR